MLLATTFDPAVLDEKRCKSDEAYIGCLRDHFRSLIHCHVLIGMTGSHIKAEFRRRLEYLPENMRSMGENLLPELRDRFVQIDEPPDDYVEQQEYVCDASRAAVTLVNNVPGIDAAIVHEDTKAAAEMNGMAIDKLFTLGAFRSSTLADRERWARGAIPIGGMTDKEFRDKIIMPSVYWAKNVKLIDKQIGKAVADQGGNLESFQSTAWLVYDTWKCGHYANAGKGLFELITVAAEREDGRPITAESVATAMDPEERRISFRVKPLARRSVLYQAQHDRYISTSLDVCIGISSGLDVVRRNRICGAGDAYLRYCPNDENDVIARWEEVEPGDDVFNWPADFIKYA